MKHSMRLIALFLFVCVCCSLSADDQAADLKVRHIKGQTFITWKEVNPPEAADGIDMQVLRGIVRGLDKKYGKVRYMIYRSDKPIKSLEGLKPVGTARQLSCWNIDFYGKTHRKGYKAARRVAREGESPLSRGTGIYVHNPQLPEGSKPDAVMKGYYAVVYAKDGKENRQLSEANTTVKEIEEIQGQGVPVLQRIVKPEKHFNYIKNATLHYYVRWEAPPNASRENMPIDYVVAVPPKKVEPAPVGLHLHCWGANLNGGYGWWYKAEQGAVLIASNQIPYDWWTGYHELYYQGSRKQADWEKGVVHPYSTTRMISFLDWAVPTYNLDTTRVFTAGNSMGGSGAPMFAIRYSERIAWSVGWVGVHDAGNTPRFTGSYEGVYGKKGWNVKFEDGTPVFDYYKDAWYLRKYPAKEIGFITWANGKNDGAIGWPQAVEFYQAMQETRRPHIFVWGMSGHMQRASHLISLSDRSMPVDIRLDQSLPAFTKCSLDSDPGTAKKLDTPKEIKQKNGKVIKDMFDGDTFGQVNKYLFWETKDVVDEKLRWEMTVGLVSKAPKDECTVNITPRRMQSFKHEPGTEVKWTNSTKGKEVQTGTAKVDQWGLITLPGVNVSKAKNRIVITK